jgi:HEAT repeat protein
MFLGDESDRVKAAAARIMLAAKSIDPEVLVPLVDSRDKIVRAAAIALLAKHEGAKDPEWFELGLRDPEAHVRTATAEQMGVLNPARHRSLFELALYDPNPKVAAQAEKLAAASGIGRRY